MCLNKTIILIRLHIFMPYILIILHITSYICLTYIFNFHKLPYTVFNSLHYDSWFILPLQILNTLLAWIFLGFFGHWQYFWMYQSLVQHDGSCFCSLCFLPLWLSFKIKLSDTALMSYFSSRWWRIIWGCDKEDDLRKSSLNFFLCS